MSNFNKVILMGNLTKDPEMKYSNDGIAICRFSIAVNRVYGTGDDKKTDTLFIDSVAFRRQAEIMGEYTKKGSLVLIEGRLQLERWQTDNGENRQKISMVTENVRLMPARDSQPDKTYVQQGQNSGSQGTWEQDDIPF